MKKLALKHVNAFTADPYSGNPAGVVLDARGLSDQKMQLIAREMALPETAFILPATLRGVDIQIRWFTPAMEVPLCGHATIGAFHALAEEDELGMKENGTYIFKVQTKSGVLRVTVEKKASGSIVEFQLPMMQFSRLGRVPLDLTRALGLKNSDLDRLLPVARANYLYVPVRSLTKLHKLEPDMAALTRALKAQRVIGVCVLTLRTVEESSSFHSRFFAPVAGIPEDPVTGSSNGPIGIYLYTYAFRRGVVLPSLSLGDGRLEIVGEQGDVLGRRGRVKVRLRFKKGELYEIAIAGEATTIFTTELKV